MDSRRQPGLAAARPSAASPSGATRMRRLLALAAATTCLGLPLLVACAGNPGTQSGTQSGDGSEPALELTLSDSDPRLIRTNAAIGGASMQALLTGTLSVGRGNCLGIATDKGTAVPAFPHTAVLLDGGRIGIDIQGRRYLVGDQVSFGGGLAVLGEDDKRDLAPCLGEGDTDIFLIQSFGP